MDFNGFGEIGTSKSLTPRAVYIGQMATRKTFLFAPISVDHFSAESEREKNQCWKSWHNPFFYIIRSTRPKRSVLCIVQEAQSELPILSCYSYVRDRRPISPQIYTNAQLVDCSCTETSWQLIHEHQAHRKAMPPAEKVTQDLMTALLGLGLHPANQRDATIT